MGSEQWHARTSVGHVVLDVQFGASRFLECSCGHLIADAESDDEQGHEFSRHRRNAPPETRERIKELRPLMFAHAGAHGAG